MKAEGARRFEWLPAVLAAAAFVAFAAAFVYELLAYQGLVTGWAKGDLESRARLAAVSLAEPLRTQNIREIQRIGDELAADGMRLRVTGVHGGIGMVFDTHRDADAGYLFSSRYESGDHDILLGVPRSKVTAPFRRALQGFVLAGLVGVAGVLLFFFVTYRQRVRIRELAKLEKFRREFVADVSHEIKTPLSGILGAVDLLREEGKEKREEGTGKREEGRGVEERLVGMIEKESKRLNGLVQSILDLARLEREGDVLDVAEFDLGEMLKELAAKYKVRYDGSDRCANVVFGDASLILRAVSNLVENARRHAGTDDVALSLSRHDGRAHVVVEDHGVGIPPEHAARVFERFHRVDPARASETGGAGLGLAIVRRIARLHGGEVTLAPAKPRGCRFDFSIPMRPSSIR